LFQNSKFDTVKIWEFCGCPNANPPTSHSSFICIAIYILSLSRNSASQGTVFIMFSLTHTKHCNQLSVKQTHKLTIVNQHHFQVLQDDGKVVKQNKHHFSDTPLPLSDAIFEDKFDWLTVPDPCIETPSTSLHPSLSKLS
jgi:hypothetical protein